MPTLTSAQLVALLDQHAPWGPLPLCPPLHAWQARDELPLWSALEAAAGARVPPPMYGMAWPGSQALARVIQDGTVAVSKRRVLDVGCGSGVAAVAAALHGGRAVGVDVDPLALMAAEELAERHETQVGTLCADPLDDATLTAPFEVILGGDLFYDEQTAQRGMRAVRRWLTEGKSVVLADAGRPFFDACDLPLLWEADVPVARSVEGVGSRVVRVYGRV
ncbi:MAG: methyltransferase domain-containing protein [Myxococcota bacterium]